MSLDEREAMHQAYSTPTYTAPTEPADHFQHADGSRSGARRDELLPAAARWASCPPRRRRRPSPPDPARPTAAEHEVDSLDGADLFGGHFYGSDPADADLVEGGPASYAADPAQTDAAALLQPPPRRSAERERRRRRRHRRLLLVFVVVILLVVAAAGWVGYKAFSPKPVADWTGAGTGSTIDPREPRRRRERDRQPRWSTDKVVASVTAFTRAAAKNSKSADIAPGAYQLRLHMSGTAALNLLLDPAAHLVVKVTVPEGTIEKDIIAKLASALKVPVATVTAAAADIPNLGIPDGYAPASGPLTSAEGFLYPDTYSLDPSTKPADALQQMTSEFTTEDRSIGFADGAKALQPHALPGADHRLDRAGRGQVPGRRVEGRAGHPEPARGEHAAADRRDERLRGRDAGPRPEQGQLRDPRLAVQHLPARRPAADPDRQPGRLDPQGRRSRPPTGNWLYYVNGDAAGHLFFTNDVNAFEAAVAKCQAENWGCG